MTANEIANKLMSSLTMEYDCDEYMEQAATMLCQQQAKIEALKAKMSLNSYDEGKNVANQLLQADNEPVAWMLLGLEDRKPKLINPQIIDHLEGTWIPLYTHPMRELTDEEIESTYWSLVGKQHQGKIASYLYNFARDILQKASEK